MKNGFGVSSQSIINTSITQSFNSIDKFPVSDCHYVAVSDEGILYILDKSSEVDKTIETINEMKLLDELEDSLVEDKNIAKNKIDKKKTNRFTTKFTPY